MVELGTGFQLSSNGRLASLVVLLLVLFMTGD